MLDYILSKTVMLLFLLLTVAAFVMVKDSLADYFIQQSAVQFAKTSVSRISAIVGDSTAMSYTEVIPLSPGISGGGKQMAYEVNILCKRDGGAANSVLLGFAVLNPMKKLIGFSATKLSNPFGSLEVKICFPPLTDVVARSTKEHYIMIKKTPLESSGAVGSIQLVLAPSVDGTSEECDHWVTCP